LTIILKEKDRKVGHQRDGRINSTNPKIGRGQKGQKLAVYDAGDRFVLYMSVGIL
jgi:hypothetical protein